MKGQTVFNHHLASAGLEMEFDLDTLPDASYYVTVKNNAANLPKLRGRTIHNVVVIPCSRMDAARDLVNAMEAKEEFSDGKVLWLKPKSKTRVLYTVMEM